ncbi:MAG: putative Fe-S cluster protein YjdI [Saprospiraceae bacterium]|jgi:uncharacterized Fe-S cluster protein YjdI
MSEKIKHYSNGDITPVWNPELCHHAGECVKGLPHIFKPKERPWINTEGCATDPLKSTMQQIPSNQQ